MNDPKNPSNLFQNVCINCGLCCDGTLFDKAYAPELENNEFFNFKNNKLTGKQCFDLPCKHHNQRCTLQLDKRAYVCSAYSSKLLKNIHASNMTDEEGIERIGQAKQQIDLVETELARYVPEATGSINQKIDTFQAKYTKQLGEVGFRKKHQSTLLKYVALKRFLDIHFKYDEHSLMEQR